MDTIPNFDGMFRQDIVAWIRRHRPLTPTVAARLFPHLPTGYISYARCLFHYAMKKAVAMKCREKGLIAKALKYEAFCDKIYNLLPPAARW